MGKTVLHELLAVEQSAAETANRITKETTKTLDSKSSLFTGMSKSHEIFAEDQQHLTQATEYKEVQSTVDEQIDFLGKELSRYWDITFQKEEANQRANADIIVDGVTVASNVPSMVLLGMEKKLTSLLAVYNAIPTLDSAKSWIPAEDHAKPNVWKTQNVVERQHVVVAKDWKEVSPATEYHPAQLVQVEKTDVIGKYTINEFCGALTSLDKANRLARLTALIRAVKTARQRANTVEVNTQATSFGESLMNFVNKG